MANSRTLLNIGLLALLAGLVLLVFFEPGLEIPPEPVKLSSLDENSIDRIQIQRQELPPLNLEKQNGKWLVAEQNLMPANEFKVLTLLSLLNAEAERSYSTTELNLSKLHLDTAIASVIFDGSFEVNFGTTESLNYHRYVQIGDRVYLIKDRYQHLVEADFTSFVDNRLLPENSQIRRLDLPTMTLDQSNTVHWSLTPEDTAVSADALSQLVNAWKRASAMWVRLYNGDSSEQQIQVHLKDDQDPIVFNIVSQQPELILARPDWKIQYHFPANSAQQMFQFEEPENESPR